MMFADAAMMAVMGAKMLGRWLVARQVNCGPPNRIEGCPTCPARDPDTKRQLLERSQHSENAVAFLVDHWVPLSF